MILTLLAIYLVGIFVLYVYMFGKIKNESVEYKGRRATRAEKQKGTAQFALLWPVSLPLTILYAIVLIAAKAFR